MKRTVLISLVLFSIAVAVILILWLKKDRLTEKVPPSVRDPHEVTLATQAFLREPTLPLSVSPDGSRFLMQTQDTTGYSLFLFDRKSQTQKGIIQTGPRPRLVSWSPDGNMISFSTDGGKSQYQLFIWDLVSLKILRPKVPTTRIVTQVKWSPTSRFLTHVTERAGQPRRLFRVEAKDGALPIEVAPDITPKASMAWSPDESAIATVKSRTAFAVTIVPFHGQERDISFEVGSEIRDLTFSPNGQELLLTVRRKEDEYFRLGKANLTTGTIHVLPPPSAEGDVLQPMFLPNGRGIVYRVYTSTEKQIHFCNPDGEMCRLLGPPQAQFTPWVISPDSQRLFISQQYPRLVFEVDLASGKYTPIYNTPPPEGVGANGGRLDIPSFDGLNMPLHLRQAKPVPGMSPALFIHILGAIGKESSPPWDNKTQYLFERGISTLKVYVRGKAGFGRKWLDAPGGTQGRVKDILAAIDYAIQVLHFPADRIVLFGHSDGAVLAAKATAAGATIRGLVISSMLRDPDPVPPVKPRCVIAFQGSQDSLSPENARVEIERILGPNTTREPCGKLQAIEGEAHELERAESWAEVFAAIITTLK